jgi:hypothetical protein
VFNESGYGHRIYFLSSVNRLLFLYFSKVSYVLDNSDYRNRALVLYTVLKSLRYFSISEFKISNILRMYRVNIYKVI